MTHREQNIGKHGQLQAGHALSMIGIEMVEQIGSPVRLVPSGRNDNTFRVIWGEKVSGDHRGILMGGRSVLAETKTILDRNLTWSDLREHQPGRLDSHKSFGGLSLLVWVHSSGVYIMEWPIKDFGPHKGLTPARASQLNLTGIELIKP